MGCIYRQRNSKNYWIKYYGRDGKPHYESSGSDKKGVAVGLLKLREGDIEHGIPVTAKIGRLTFDEAARDLITEYQTNGRKSLDELSRRIDKHLRPFFEGRRMATITTSDVRTYLAHRQAETAIVRRAHDVKRKDGTVRHVPEHRRTIAGVSNAEINRELTILKRMFTLEIQAGKLLHRPHIPMLKERNVRAGFFECEQYLAVLRHLPTAIRPIITFAYITGWRIASEVLPLQWRQVDFNAGTVRLDPDTTKNGEGREFRMTRELRTLLELQRPQNAKRAAIIPWVFHREGEPIKRFNKVWARACRAAGCPGRIPHDLRRTAVRNIVRAGVPERVAMQLTGHKTRSVFERYNIVSEGDLTDAARRLDALPATGQAVAQRGA